MIVRNFCGEGSRIIWILVDIFNECGLNGCFFLSLEFGVYYELIFIDGIDLF